MNPRLGFGPFAFDRASGTLWRDGTLVPVGSRGAALLGALIDSETGVVTKADLMDRAWPGVDVEESNLVVQVATLRKILGRRPDGEEWITTVARVGYRLVREGGEAPESGRPAIAILPFVTIGGDPGQDYIAEGLVEDLITGLSRFKTIAVLARNSGALYKDRAIDVREVGRGLGARYVLEGSIRRGADRIRVNVQLIDATTGAHVWAEGFDGAFADVLGINDRITSVVVGLIEPHIRQAELERMRRKPPESFDAYDLYLQALHHAQGVRIVRAVDYDAAIALLDRAIALDPDYAPALALCAWCHEKRLNRHGTRLDGVDDAERALVLAERALTADATDPLAVLVAGIVAMTIRADFETGYALIRHAFALNPNSAVIATTAATSTRRSIATSAPSPPARACRRTSGAPAASRVPIWRLAVSRTP